MRSIHFAPLMACVLLFGVLPVLHARASLPPASKGLFKPTGNYGNGRLEGTHDRNRLRTVFYNYGSVGGPNTEPSFEWPAGSGHGYANEMGLIIGAEVNDSHHKKIHIFSEGLIDGGDRSPSGDVWGWAPLPGYAGPEPNQSIALSDDPATWPEDWTEWPQPVIADQQSYWIMDDADNREFDYFPFPEDTTRRGLGLQILCQGYQWDNPFDEDFIIFTYDITNVSAKALDKVVAGLFGDPHIGGPGDFSDDYVGYIDNDGKDSKTGRTFPVAGLVYFYDHENSGNDYGLPWEKLGWFGAQFLETPPDDNGAPLGLTSFEAPVYGSDDGAPAFDEQMWRVYQPGNFNHLNQGNETDNELAAGSGYFSLSPGETKRLAVAFLLGAGQNDLVWNAINAQLAYAKLTGDSLARVKILSPVQNQQVNSTVDIQWETTNPTGDPVTVDLYYCNHKGTGFQPIASDLPANGSYTWDISGLEDGVNYRIAAIAMTEKAVGRGLSDYFVVNQPDVTAPPEIILQYPVHEKELKGDVHIVWRAGDADGDAVQIRIYYSSDNGASWQILADQLENTGTYIWNTRKIANGTSYIIKLSAIANETETETLPGLPFSINNEYEFVPDSLIVHTRGSGDGSILVSIVDATQTTGHRYRITFDDSSAAKTTYDVQDLETGVWVLNDADQLTPDFSGPEFDGIRLIVDTYDEVSLNEDQTGWMAGDAHVTFEVTRSGAGIFLPVDYEIRFYDTFVDTSLYVNPQPVKFKIWDVTHHVAKKAMFYDLNSDGEFSVDDYIYIIDSLDNAPKKSWKIKMMAPDTGETVLPHEGDVFRIVTYKPFSGQDVFEFQAPEAEETGISSRLNTEREYHIAQNYPNPFNSTTVFRYRIARPAHVTLTIYDVTGREVVRLVNQKQPAGNFKVVWNGKNRQKQTVASGLYFYKFEAGKRTVLKKCLLIK